MREKKMGMRAALTRLLGIATVACALVASPAAAEAATTADIPQDVILAQRSNTGLQYPYSVKLEAGKDYVIGGEITLGYYEVEGGTKDDPTRVYFSNKPKYGGTIVDKRDSTSGELFVLKGGYIEFIGTNGSFQTQFDCNGHSFLSDDANPDKTYGADSVIDKRCAGGSLNFKMSGIELGTITGKRSKRAIALYGTMDGGESAVFEDVSVIGWDCRTGTASYGHDHNYGNSTYLYTASPAPVTIRGSQNSGKSLDATFNNCTFEGNCDNCAGALSVVGRGFRPNVVLNNCTFNNNRQESIWCKSLGVEDTNEHTHAGNIVVNNSDVTLNNCLVQSMDSRVPAANYTQDMVMTSAIAVAKDSSCTLNNTKISDTYAEGTYYYADANTRRNTVYARGTVTLAGNTTITTNGDKGARGLALDTPGISYLSKLNIAESFTGKVQLSLKDDQLALIRARSGHSAPAASKRPTCALVLLRTIRASASERQTTDVCTPCACRTSMCGRWKRPPTAHVS